MTMLSKLVGLSLWLQNNINNWKLTWGVEEIATSKNKDNATKLCNELY